MDLSSESAVSGSSDDDDDGAAATFDDDDDDDKTAKRSSVPAHFVPPYKFCVSLALRRMRWISLTNCSHILFREMGIILINSHD